MSSNKRPSYSKAYEAWSTLFVTEVFSIPLTRVLAALRISPNLITSLSLISGLVTGLFFARGEWIVGALLFELSCFFDNIDGKVARLRCMTSEFGVKLEWIADVTRKPSSFLGIAVFFYLQNRPLGVVLTAVAFVAHFGLHKLYGLAKVSEYDLEFPNFHRKVLRRIAPRLLNVHNFFDEQFLEFVTVPLIIGIIGPQRNAAWFLYGVAIVTFLGLLKMVNSLNFRRKGLYDQIYQDWTGTKGNLDQA